MKYIIIFITIFTSPAFADLYLCGGTWTNQECSEDVVKTVEEVDRPARSEAETLKDQKALSLLLLTNLKSKAERSTDLEFSIKDVIRTCQDTKSTLKECQDLAEGKIKEINSTLNDIKIKKQAEVKVEPPEEPVVNVVVQDNRDPFYQWLLRNRALGRIGNRPVTNPAVRGVNRQPARTVEEAPVTKPARPPRRIQSSGIREIVPKAKIGTR